MTATPAKLRDGTWGARVAGPVQPGDTVTITTKAGKSWQARVDRVVWSGDGVSLCATSSLDSDPRRASPAPRAAGQPRRAGVCEGVRLSHYRVGARDASTLVGKVWRLRDDNGNPADVRGRVVVTVGAEVWYQTADDNEDMGDMQGGGWGATRWVRLATDEEAAPLLASEQEATQRDADRNRVREIVDALLRYDGPSRRSEAEANDYRAPEGAEEWRWDPRAGTTGGILYVYGDTVAAWDSGHYDDYRRSLGIADDAALAAEVRALHARAGAAARSQ